MKLKAWFLRPHQDPFLSGPIFLVSFQAIDMVLLPKTGSTKSQKIPKAFT